MTYIASASATRQRLGSSARPVAVLLLACGILGGAETKIRDVRFFGGVTPTSDTPEITYDSTNRGRAQTVFANSDDAKLDFGPRVGVEVVESWGTLGGAGGLIIGLEYAYSQQRSANTPHAPQWAVAPTFDVTQTGPIEANINAFDLEIGWAIPMTRYFHFEIVGFGGIGSLTIDDDGPAYGDAQHVNGPYQEFGGRAGLFWTHPRGFQVGLEGGYLVSHGRSALRYDEYDTLTGDVVGRWDITYEIDQAGPFGSLTVGMRF
jgi:hypothetical protein